MQFDILTLFPEIFSSYVSQSILSKAIESGLVQIDLHDIRNWTLDKHQRVDDRPYGVEAIQKTGEISGHLIMLTPTGKPLNQRLVEELVQRPRHILLCGRYEGFDQRVVDILSPLEISIGDYILNGGEVGAMALIDSMIRLVPGVLGDEQSSQDDSFSTGNRLLEFPHYTRPRDFRGHSVPEVLLSGDHGAIAQWRQEQSLQRTRERREDLL